jgi:hypothetical protein
VYEGCGFDNFLRDSGRSVYHIFTASSFFHRDLSTFTVISTNNASSVDKLKSWAISYLSMAVRNSFRYRDIWRIG